MATTSVRSLYGSRSNSHKKARSLPSIKLSTDSSPILTIRSLHTPEYASAAEHECDSLSLATKISSGIMSSGVDQSDAVIRTETKSELICSWLRQQQLQHTWSTGGNCEGVILKEGKDGYICFPQSLANETRGLLSAVRKLQAQCAMTVNTRTVKLLLEHTNATQVRLKDGLALQILPSIASLSFCQKQRFACFFRNPGILVVWENDPSRIVGRVQDLERQITSMLWNDRFNAEKVAYLDDKQPTSSMEMANHTQGEPHTTKPRRIILIQPAIVAVTILLMFTALGTGWRSLVVEIRYDHNWSRLLFLIISPLQGWLGLFFMQSLVTCAAQMFGSVRQMNANSMSYSGLSPPRLSNCALPHITVQCPVYKEGLWTVIDPTMKSVAAAISTYEIQGGTANIFVNDDGLQLLSKYDAEERIAYYEEHNIGWVARPKDNSISTSNGKPFVRTGKFKKASNMNYGLNFSTRIEKALNDLQRPDDWTAEQETAAYRLAFAQMIDEDQGSTWAAGNVRIGDLILLIDSDSRVPSDCFLDAASEMEQSSNVAILQYSSGVMNVTESWFEKGITFFTNLVYTAIKFAVSSGDVAPFVGHNAILRWSAVQYVAYTTPNQPGYEIFWSEDTVSEDFDMALRLQTCGYNLRFATYTGLGFREGVSLTVYDELARWEKYAYGCSELILNPLSLWLHKGPFTALFKRFICSRMPLHSKITIMAYIGTYFAIASAWILTLVNYIIVGWYNGHLDHYYLDSFHIYFSVLIVFNVIGNVALALLHYRTNGRSLVPALLENFKWVILLTIFLGGISLHLSQAILCHLFSVKMTWGATSKEARSSPLFQEIPIILRKFRFTFVVCCILTIVMVVLSGVGPFSDIIPCEWRIDKFVAIFPLGVLVASHALLPLVLNPGLMQFTF